MGIQELFDMSHDMLGLIERDGILSLLINEGLQKTEEDPALPPTTDPASRTEGVLKFHDQ